MDAFDSKRQRDLKTKLQNKVSEDAKEALEDKIYIELHEYLVIDKTEPEPSNWNKHIDRKLYDGYKEGYMLAKISSEVSAHIISCSLINSVLLWIGRWSLVLAYVLLQGPL